MAEKWGVWCLGLGLWLRDDTGDPEYTMYDVTYGTKAEADEDIKSFCIKATRKNYEARRYTS